MNPQERMERASAAFADKLVELIENRVQLALQLEHDRIASELAELTRDVTGLAEAVMRLTGVVQSLIGPTELHSVRVPDDH